MGAPARSSSCCPEEVERNSWVRVGASIATRRDGGFWMSVPRSVFGGLFGLLVLVASPEHPLSKAASKTQRVGATLLDNLVFRPARQLHGRIGLRTNGTST